MFHFYLNFNFELKKKEKLLQVFIFFKARANNEEHLEFIFEVINRIS